MKKYIKKFLDKISYTNRHQKEIAEYQAKKEKYLQMSDDEFEVEYIKIKAKSDSNNIVFGASWCTVIGSIFIVLYKYIATLKNNMEILEMNASETYVIYKANLFIVVVLICLGLSLLFQIIKSRNNILKEKIFLEEMRTQRVENKVKNA